MGLDFFDILIFFDGPFFIIILCLVVLTVVNITVRLVGIMFSFSHGLNLIFINLE